MILGGVFRLAPASIVSIRGRPSWARPAFGGYDDTAKLA